VTAITVLRTLGKRLDAQTMRTLITWTGKPGPLRVIDITWYYTPAGPGAGSGGGYH
jgi:hypothetical protein